jgi:hypothetical protein
LKKYLLLVSFIDLPIFLHGIVVILLKDTEKSEQNKGLIVLYWRMGIVNVLAEAITKAKIKNMCMSSN